MTRGSRESETDRLHRVLSSQKQLQTIKSRRRLMFTQPQICTLFFGCQGRIHGQIHVYFESYLATKIRMIIDSQELIILLVLP